MKQIDTQGRNCRDFELFYKDLRQFEVEALQMYSLNFVSFHLVMVGFGWHIVKLYLTLHNASILERVMVAIVQPPLSCRDPCRR